jgi:hypothetical protein
MKKVAFTLTLVVAICVCAVMTISGREKETETEKRFTFQTIFFPGDTFTQLLGINDFDVIAGYHGANVNKGFVFTFPNTFTPENFPNSAQTQVIGINNRGFIFDDGHFQSVDDPNGVGTTLINGINNRGQVVGFFVDGAGNTDGFVASFRREHGDGREREDD